MEQAAYWFYATGIALLLLTAVRSSLTAMRRRDLRAADLVALPAAIVIAQFLRLPRSAFVEFVRIVTFLSVPFWLLRLADRFTVVPRTLLRAAALGAVVVGALLASPLRTNLYLLRVATSAVVGAVACYVAAAFTREFTRTGGVTAHRVAVAAVGIWAYVALMVVYVVQIDPSVRGLSVEWQWGLGGITCFSYYFAFDTPRVWKAQWQRTEQARYLSAAAARDAEDRGARAADDLCRAAARTVGNAVVLVALRARERPEAGLSVRAATHVALIGLPIALDDGVVAESCDSRQTRDRPVEAADPALAATLAPYGSRVLVAPITSAVETWGVVIAVQRRGSLFPEDDLLMLGQFARYAATALDHAELVAERRDRIQRAADRRVRELESRTSLMLDSIKDYAMVILDDDGCVVTWQPGAELVFGYPAAEVTDEPIGPLLGLPPADVAALLAEARRIGHAEREGVCRRRDGSKFVGATTLRPLEGEDVPGFVAVTRDVTAQRDLEDRLRQSQKMDAIGRLAGGIAHDFNNQLAAILGYAERLTRVITEDAPRGELAEIQKAADRAAGLTRQLLAFSRRQLLEPVVIDLTGLIDDLVPMLQRVIGEHVAVVHTGEAPAISVRGDRSQLEQVIVNLAVNARDAMPAGGHLTIATRREWLDAETAGREASPGLYALLEVIDDGVGMDAATQARIFEPFFTTKEFGDGTGLGLATVYGIVHQMGGLVRVASAPGEGATFRLYLPSVDARPGGRPAAPIEAAATGTATETILIVEDEAAVRTLFAQALEGHGYRVLTADRRDAAIAVARGHGDRIDLLITDVLMPGGTGPELVEALEAIQAGVPVLYVSGFADAVLGSRGAFPKASHFLQKPFSAAELLLRVAQILSRR